MFAVNLSLQVDCFSKLDLNIFGEKYFSFGSIIASKIYHDTTQNVHKKNKVAIPRGDNWRSVWFSFFIDLWVTRLSLSNYELRKHHVRFFNLHTLLGRAVAIQTKRFIKKHEQLSAKELCVHQPCYKMKTRNIKKATDFYPFTYSVPNENALAVIAIFCFVRIALLLVALLFNIFPKLTANNSRSNL